jgi:hypothetical protein
VVGPLGAVAGAAGPPADVVNKYMRYCRLESIGYSDV